MGCFAIADCKVADKEGDILIFFKLQAVVYKLITNGQRCGMIQLFMFSDRCSRAALLKIVI